MRKLLAILMVLGLVLCMLPVAAAVELPMELGEAVDQVSAYFTSVMGEGVYSDWAVLQLARSGNLTEAMRQDYLDTLEKTLKDCGGVLDESFYTPYSRTVIVLTACGVNARDFAGYDLTAPLNDFDQTVYQGINGAAFALIAHGYCRICLFRPGRQFPPAAGGLPAGQGACRRRLGLFR